MKVQVYGYLNNPRSSISMICAEWTRTLLLDGFNIKIKDYVDQGNAYGFINEDIIGEHEEISPIGIYIGYPSYLQTIGNVLAKHKIKVGVFVTETGLSDKEQAYLRNIPYAKVCVPSMYCKEIFQKFIDPSKIMVVNHGIGKEFTCGTSIRAKPDEFTFLYIYQRSASGGTQQRKNIESLLHGFDLVRREFPIQGARLLIKTSPDVECDIHKEMKYHPGVEFEIKLMSRDELVTMYQSSHAYINPSRAEGFGITVVEAMSQGIPVVSPVHSGLTEFLNNGNCVPIKATPGKEIFKHGTNNGVLWDIDRLSIRDSMVECIRNYDRYKRIAESQMSFIKEKYSWKNAMEEFSSWMKGQLS